MIDAAGRVDVDARTGARRRGTARRRGSSRPPPSPPEPRGAAPCSRRPPVLPADAATNTPPSTSDRTAAASASDRPKLHDITATAGRCALRATQSIPDSSDDSVPDAVAVEHLHRPDLRPRRHAVQARRRDPGDDGAVAVAVVGRVVDGVERRPGTALELRVRRVDPGVEHVDGHPGPGRLHGRRPSSGSARWSIRSSPQLPGGAACASDSRNVRGSGGAPARSGSTPSTPGVRAHPAQLRGVERRGEPGDRAAEHRGRRDPLAGRPAGVARRAVCTIQVAGSAAAVPAPARLAASAGRSPRQRAQGGSRCATLRGRELGVRDTIGGRVTPRRHGVTLV